MTPQQIKAMKLALEALEACNIYGELECVMTPDSAIYLHPAITAIKEALAEHAMQEVQRLGQEIEQEPMAHCKVRPLRGDESFPKVEIDWVNHPIPGPLYTSPPQRKPLTDYQIQRIWDVASGALPGWSRHIAYARAIEAAHGIKENT
jgi:hypothetical protein